MQAEIAALPPREAIEALRRRGANLEPSFSWMDLWEGEHARAFTVAKSAGFDILTDIYEATDAALSDGTTFRDFSKRLTPVLQEKGWWGRQLVTDPLTGEERLAQLGSLLRLRTIFDANLRVSYAAGHWTNFERNKAVRPFLRYVCILDEATRPAHRARHNLVLPVDSPYWDTWAPPCGWGCRCTLQSLSQRDVERLQREGEALRFAPPADTFRNFRNIRTGEITRVPDGIDPGWAYNPGKAGAEASVNTVFAAKVAAAPPDLAAAAIADRVRSDAFRRFLADPQGDMPVFVVPAEVTEATNAQASVGVLSAETMRKQLTRHPELTAEDYAFLPRIVEEATLIVQDAENKFVCVKMADGRWRYAAIKTTRASGD